MEGLGTWTHHLCVFENLLTCLIINYKELLQKILVSEEYPISVKRSNSICHIIMIILSNPEVTLRDQKRTSIEVFWGRYPLKMYREVNQGECISRTFIIKYKTKCWSTPSRLPFSGDPFSPVASLIFPHHCCLHPPPHRSARSRPPPSGFLSVTVRVINGK